MEIEMTREYMEIIHQSIRKNINTRYKHIRENIIK